MGGNDLSGIFELAADWGGDVWMRIALVAVGAIVWFAARARKQAEAARLSGRIGETAGARFKSSLPDSIHVLAAFGEKRSGADLRTTWGLRLVSLIVTMGILGLLWIQSPGVFIPKGPATVLVSALLLVPMAGIWLFRARIDDGRLSVRQWIVWRRSWAWDDLCAVRQDGGYELVLDFGAAGRARLPKHLAGIDALLNVAGEALDRNEPATCPNSPRSKPSAADFSPSCRTGGSPAR
jgi:hypothetical protein